MNTATDTVTDRLTDSLARPAAFPPELPPGVLPEVDWIQLFPCGYGGAVDGARLKDGPGKYRTYANYSPLGGRWNSQAYLAAGGTYEPESLRGMGAMRNALHGGAVRSGRTLVVPLERLERAFRICQWWLAVRDLPGIIEWSPAFGTGPAGCFYGVRILARDTCWGRLAEVLGATWRITTVEGEHSGFCLVGDTRGNVLAWNEGPLAYVNCTRLAASLPLPKGRWREYPAPPPERANVRS